jgi:hypothetical protein
MSNILIYRDIIQHEKNVENVSVENVSVDNVSVENVIIDNVLVSKYKNGFTLTPLSLLAKHKIDVSHVPKVTIGTRLLDNKLLCELATKPGIKYESIFEKKNLRFV